MPVKASPARPIPARRTERSVLETNLDTAQRLAHGITRQGAKAIVQGHLPLIRRNQKEKELRGKARLQQYKAK
eukprot:13683470-Heterocapsa_arctica.AAC.1